MATCKKCGKTISDGFEYCSDCSAKNQADESYLDSLLSSVSATTENPLTARKKVVHSTAEPVMPKFLASTLAKKEASKFEDAIFEELNSQEKPLENEKYDILSITDEDYLDNLFEDGNVEIFANEEAFSAEIKKDARRANVETEADFLDDLLKSVDENAANMEEEEAPAEDPLEALDEAFAMAEASGEASDGIPEELLAEAPSELSEETATEATTEVEPSNSIDFFGEQKESTEKQAGEEPTDEDPELTFAEIPGMELIGGDDSADDNGSDDETEAEENQQTSKVTLVESEENQDGGEEILEFWNNINGEENGSDGGPGPEAPASADDNSAGLGFSPEQDELAALLAGLPEIDDGGLDIPDKSAANEIETPEEKTTEPKKKKSIWVRLFGNIKEDISDEEREARKQAALDKFEADQNAAEAAKLQKAEEKAAAKAEADELKKAKKVQQEEAKKLKAEQKKAEKDKKAAARKALLEELDDDDGKINKIGASLVFLVFAIMLCFISVGTSVYTYRVAISNAEDHFEQDKYNEAYQDIYGIDVKEEDKLLYDQIMTVQYVNTQLLSYLKYTGLEMENEALDSLLKGLRRYEKYIAYAKELHVEDDLNYLRTQILDELLDKYGLSEARAYEIINNVTQEAYSKAVREIIQNMLNEANGAS